jgi:glycosyltransferase involved in cell wall biosynthesis
MLKNNGNTYGVCLSSAVKSLLFDKEIIVVEAHSIDNASELSKSFRPNVKVAHDEGKVLGEDAVELLDARKKTTENLFYKVGVRSATRYVEIINDYPQSHVTRVKRTMNKRAKSI